MNDCIFIADISLNFVTTYSEDGVFVRDRGKVARAYLASWFPLDFLATFPIGWFTDNLLPNGTGGANFSGINRILRMLRLFKLFRLLRLLKLFPRMLGVLEDVVRVSPPVISFFKSIVMLIMLWHMEGARAGGERMGRPSSRTVSPPLSAGCAYWFVVRSEYGGTAACAPLPGRRDRTCFVNQCLCDVDLSRDPSLVTVINGTTDTTWYDPDNPDLWVPPAFFADLGLMDQ